MKTDTPAPAMTWSQTRAGRKWDFMAPRAADVNFSDVAHALGNLCRFNGHTNTFYSVAEHSVHVCDTVADMGGDALLQLKALLHDAHEAYLGDMTTPLANAIALDVPGFKSTWGAYKVLHDIEIYKAAGISPGDGADAKVIKAADLAVMMAERDVLMEDPPSPWGALEDIQRAPALIEGLTPAAASARFLGRLDGLLNATGKQVA